MHVWVCVSHAYQAVAHLLPLEEHNHADANTALQPLYTVCREFRTAVQDPFNAGMNPDMEFVARCNAARICTAVFDAMLAQRLVLGDTHEKRRLPAFQPLATDFALQSDRLAALHRTILAAADSTFQQYGQSVSSDAACFVAMLYLMPLLWTFLLTTLDATRAAAVFVHNKMAVLGVLEPAALEFLVRSFVAVQRKC